MIALALQEAPPAAEWVRFLPDLNALLNATAFTLVALGLAAIKRGDEARHKRLMLSAVAVSAAFLVSYLVYHFHVGSVKFTKTGAMRVVYFAVLISHTILAVVQVPLIVITVIRGLRDQRSKHKRIAKITAPIWLYVSATGVVVYVMLYWL